jgi:hypothetical protein
MYSLNRLRSSRKPLEWQPQGLKPKFRYRSVPAGLKTRFPGLKRLRKKSLLRIESGPQRLKPDLFSISYVRAKARTLQQPEFFRSL